MAMIRFRAQIATDPATGMGRPELVGATVTIVQAGTTTPVPIWEDAAKGIPIASSQLTVTPDVFVPQFWADGFEELDAISGSNRVPIDSNVGTRNAAIAAQAAAEEARDAALSGAGGVASDSGIADLVSDPASDTSAALEARYGPGILVLDLDAVLPPGTPDGTLVARVGSGAPPITVYAADEFARAGTGGWGSADTGGVWTVSHPAQMSTVTADGGQGRISVEATSAYRFANLASVIELNQEILVTFSRDTVGTGGCVFLVRGRASGGGVTFYQAVVRIYASTHSGNPGRVDVALGKSGLNDLQDYVLGALTGYTEGRKIKVRLRLEGTNPTVVSTRAWYADAAEPTTWTRQASDSTAATQVAGQPMVGGYLTGSEGTLPQTVSVHDILMTGI
ncbi:hypothetical protein CLV28_0723 [Sediminihabitans luteus]|uniref:Uncharacterized protein n=1 Tax=Sediminihabitans luteus TaxID=1138585 RepID=A0A2M9CZY3_9CELL|nr:hypothetical protein [Sediminihabitans luteus]PJJ77504.1 hypothetical protein CLV28_0723 [Sediminihabitans luteus]GII98401.1 hypothetical protein Slu03_07790 [Sediminihabitans luteus]